MTFKTTITAKATLVEPGTEQFRSIASSLGAKYGFELRPQMDLLYVKSCLVTAGEKNGINDNDDVFTREEAWAARHTPVLKPANWQHNDKDILGVIFSTEARTLDGRLLDFDQEETPDEEFEFYTEAVVFKLIQPERAKEIAERSSAGTLYVSMEAWFDDYEYGMYDQDGSLEKIVARNTETKFLDSHLKCKGGAGKYDNCRLGRVLRDITFGGFGFVDVPANKRSVIETVDAVPAAASVEDRVEELVREFLAKSESQENGLMKVKASEDGVQVVSPEDIKAAVAEVLKEHKDAEAKATAEANLRTKAEQLGEDNENLVSENTDLKAQVEAKDGELAELKEQVNELNEVAETISASLVEAEKIVASEISGIDAVTDGDSAFSAKIALFKKMGTAMAALITRVEELEVEQAKAAQAARASEVHGLFDGLMNENEVEALVATASELSDDEYTAWAEEKALFSLALQEAATAAMPEEMKKKMEEKKKKDGEKSEASEESLVQKAIRARMNMSGDDYGSRSATPLINHPGTDEVKSGVTPGAPGLKTPRHKIAGSAEIDPKVLEQAVAQNGGVNPAGASMGEGAEGTDNDPFGFKSLAAAVTGNDGDEESNDDGSPVNFDPVS